MTKVASSTLDASVKIYAGRVDHIHTHTYKVLSGLGGGKTGNDAGNFFFALSNRSKAILVGLDIVGLMCREKKGANLSNIKIPRLLSFFFFLSRQ